MEVFQYRKIWNRIGSFHYYYYFEIFVTIVYEYFDVEKWKMMCNEIQHQLLSSHIWFKKSIKMLFCHITNSTLTCNFFTPLSFKRLYSHFSSSFETRFTNEKTWFSNLFLQANVPFLIAFLKDSSCINNFACFSFNLWHLLLLSKPCCRNLINNQLG